MSTQLSRRSYPMSASRTRYDVESSYRSSATRSMLESLKLEAQQDLAYHGEEKDEVEAWINSQLEQLDEDGELWWLQGQPEFAEEVVPIELVTERVEQFDKEVLELRNEEINRFGSELAHGHCFARSRGGIPAGSDDVLAHMRNHTNMRLKVEEGIADFAYPSARD